MRSTVASLHAPSITNFGAETPDDIVPVTLVSPPEPLRGIDREFAMPAIWPEEVMTIAALPEVDLLPAPEAANFRYNRISRSRAKKDKRPAQAQPGNQPLDWSDIKGAVPSGSQQSANAKAGKANSRQQVRQWQQIAAGPAAPNGPFRPMA